MAHIDLAAGMQAIVVEWRSQPRTGWVYFFSCGEFIKIGFSINLTLRHRALQAANPYPIVLDGAVRGTMQMERAIRRLCAEHHHRLEWFRAAPELLAAIAVVSTRRKINRRPYPMRSKEERTARRLAQQAVRSYMRAGANPSS